MVCIALRWTKLKSNWQRTEMRKNSIYDDVTNGVLQHFFHTVWWYILCLQLRYLHTVIFQLSFEPQHMYFGHFLQFWLFVGVDVGNSSDNTSFLMNNVLGNPKTIIQISSIPITRVRYLSIWVDCVNHIWILIWYWQQNSIERRIWSHLA